MYLKIKQYIFEEYRDNIEIIDLAKEILNYISHLNEDKIFLLHKNHNLFNNIEENIVILTQQYYIHNIVDINNYKFLKEFISNFDLKIQFVNKNIINGDSRYVKSKKIILVNGQQKDFHDTLMVYKKQINNLLKSNLSKITNEIFEESFKESIVHELKHAYDDYRTNGDFVIHKKTLDFFKNGDKEIKTKEDYIRYLNLPHEYWARFLETISNFNEYDWSEDFNLLYNGFKKNFIGFDFLPIKAKKRLIKSLYKLYLYKNNKI